MQTMETLPKPKPMSFATLKGAQTIADKLQAGDPEWHYAPLWSDGKWFVQVRDGDDIPAGYWSD